MTPKPSSTIDWLENEQFVSLVFPIFLIGSCFLMLVVQVVWYWCIAYCLLGVFAGSLGVLASKVANLAFEKDQIVGLNFVVGAVVVLVGGYINLWKRKKNVKVYSAFVAFCLSLQTALRVVLAFGAGAMGLVIGILSAAPAVVVFWGAISRPKTQVKKLKRQPKAKRE